MGAFSRINVNPDQMAGLPCIRNLRIPVATVVGVVSESMQEAEILKAYPNLEVEDVREAQRFASEAVRERELPVAGGLRFLVDNALAVDLNRVSFRRARFSSRSRRWIAACH